MKAIHTVSPGRISSSVEYCPCAALSPALYSNFGLGERIGPVREAGDFEAADSPHPVIASSDYEVAPLHEAVRRFCHSSTSPSHRRE